MDLCSHKKNVLDFLDQLCSFYEKNYVLATAVADDNTEALIDKICELADANGLPSKAYRSALIEFSAEEVRKHLIKVPLVALPYGPVHSGACTN